MILDFLNDTAKQVGDAISIGALLGVIVRVLPTLASILTVIWIGLRIYESVLNIRKAKRALDKD